MSDCQKCDGTGSVCLNCNQPMDDCACFDEAEPCTCDFCQGTGHPIFDDEDDALTSHKDASHG